MSPGAAHLATRNFPKCPWFLFWAPYVRRMAFNEPRGGPFGDATFPKFPWILILAPYVRKMSFN